VKELLTVWAIELEIGVLFVLPIMLILKGVSDLREDKRRRAPDEGGTDG
jgi:hypothetical protein